MSKYTYTRICPDCGDVATIGYKPKSTTLCRTCSNKKIGYEMSQRNIKKEEDKVMYTYVCSECGKVRQSRGKRKTTLCGACSRSVIGRANFNPNKVVIVRTPRVIKPKYLRICPDCPEGENTIYVSSQKNSGIKPCKKHIKRPVGDERKKVHAYNRKKPNKEVSSHAIERARAINKQHRESVVEVIVVKQTKTDNEMIAQFMKTNKVTLLDTPTSLYSGGKMVLKEIFAVY